MQCCLNGEGAGTTCTCNSNNMCTNIPADNNYYLTSFCDSSVGTNSVVPLQTFVLYLAFERYPLYLGGRYPPGERCSGSCVLGEALTAPRGVLSRLYRLSSRCTNQVNVRLYSKMQTRRVYLVMSYLV